MADPLLALDSDRVSVEPGGQASVTVRIRNNGPIVEGYRLEVLGDAAQWAEVLPPEVSVYPQQESTATVVFTPPSGPGASGGSTAFAVRARSTVDPEASAVVEGDLEIARTLGLQAKIVPVNSTGRWRGRHVVQFSNWGNAPVRLRVVATDPDNALGMLPQPDLVDLPLGGTASVRLRVRTRRPSLRGTPTRMAFQVVGERVDASATPGPALAYSDPGRPVVDGAFTQKPILSRGFVTLATLSLLAAVALAVLALRGPLNTPTLAAAPAPVATTAALPSVSPSRSPSSEPPSKEPTTATPTSPPPVTSPPPISPATSPPTSDPASPPPPPPPPPPPATSPPPSTTPPVELEGKWVAVAQSWAEIAGNGEALALEKQRELRAQKISAQYLSPQQFANTYGTPSHIVYVGPYDTPEAARSACGPIDAAQSNPCDIRQLKS